MEFAERLQRLRKEKGLSQEALAEALNVSRQAVSKWESGQSYPETDNLIALRDILGVTLDSLVKGGEAQSGASDPADAPLADAPFWTAWRSSYEYKSEKTLFGLPLVHIHIGFGLEKAKGIIAIGNIATGVLSIGLVAGGVLSLGLVGAGLIGLGCFSLGLLLAVGAVSAGVFSVGAIAVGIFSLGAVSAGMYSLGALSMASRVAIGDHAYGRVAVGRVVKGVKTFVDASARLDLSKISADAVRKAILDEFPGTWEWIVNLTTMFLG